MQHPFSTSVPSQATVGATSTKILDARSGRVYAIITNDSNQDIYIAFGRSAEMNKGHRLNAEGGLIELDGDKPFSGEVYAICSSGGKNVCVLDA